MRTTVRLPEALLARAKKKARDEGTTLTALIEEGLKEVVARSRAKSRRLVKLPVSKARGGLLPGIDPIKLNTQAQELDDLDYMERMKRFK